MKATSLGLAALLGFATITHAIDSLELDNRIRTLTAKLEALQEKPEKGIPAETLRKARGIVLMDRTKAGFVFAYQGGGGVAMVKDEKTDKWSPAAFLTANEASLGFQIGGQQSFIVILFMNTNSTRLLTEPNIQFGGEARGTAGQSSAGVEGKFAPQEASVLVYDDRRGLFGGAAVQGGSVAPDDTANAVYYREPVTMGDILFGGKVKATETVAALAAKLTAYSIPAAGK